MFGVSGAAFHLLTHSKDIYLLLPARSIGKITVNERVKMHSGCVFVSVVILKIRVCSVCGFVIKTFMGDHVSITISSHGAMAGLFPE